MSQAKRNHNMCGAVGQSALMATRTPLSMNAFIGMSWAYRFSPIARSAGQSSFYLVSFANAKKLGFVIVWRYTNFENKLEKNRVMLKL